MDKNITLIDDENVAMKKSVFMTSILMVDNQIKMLSKCLADAPEHKMNAFYQRSRQLDELIDKAERICRYLEHSLPKNIQKDGPIDQLELSIRTYNCLKNANIKTIQDLFLRSDTELKKINNLGRRAFNEIKDALKKVSVD